MILCLYKANLILMKYIRQFRHSYQATQIQIQACGAMVLCLLNKGISEILTISTGYHLMG